MSAKTPVILCILDGWGLNPNSEANAVALAHTPNFDKIMQNCPNGRLAAHGPDVGLPEGQMGNSEVGHMNIGAGRIVWMDLPKIDKAISDGEFDQNAALLDFIEKIKTTGGTAHLAGLLSDGGVHAHQNHILHAARFIASAGIPVKLHVFTDGRDVGPKTADLFVPNFESALPETAQIATVSGRFFALDRDNRWERVGDAYKAIMRGEGLAAKTGKDAVASAYERGETDEFIQPSVIEGYAGVQNGDGLFFLNFRADRAREILSALAEPGFDGFDVEPRPSFAAVLGLVEYSTRHNQFMMTMFPNQEIKNTVGEWIEKEGRTQFRLAETEKYPHVTFFLNGGVEEPYPHEARYMAPSPKVKTYDLKPEMSSEEVTEHFVEAILSQNYDLIVTNYANPDMVGHTGDLQAAIAACEAVDRGLGKVIEALQKVGGAMIVTADHGNCEVMVDPQTHGPHTAHTLNPVPVILVNGPEGAGLREKGRLADLAPSLLDLMGLKKPVDMTGESLIIT